jgi:hypothetical protein
MGNRKLTPQYLDMSNARCEIWINLTKCWSAFFICEYLYLSNRLFNCPFRPYALAQWAVQFHNRLNFGVFNRWHIEASRLSLCCERINLVDEMQYVKMLRSLYLLFLLAECFQRDLADVANGNIFVTLKTNWILSNMQWNTDTSNY